MASPILHRLPAPTLNSLDATQRARLMRSTQKLGAVLGTAPYFLEATETHTLRLLPIRSPSPAHSAKSASSAKKAKAVRRQGSIFSLPLASSSLVSLASTMSTESSASSASTSSTSTLPPQHSFSERRRRARDVPPPLVLQLTAVPVPHTDPRAPLSSPSIYSPSSTCTSEPTTPSPSLHTSTPTPLTPSFRFRAHAIPEARRQKMAKLTRQLGENIPPELVFPAHPPSRANSRRRSMSVGPARASHAIKVCFPVSPSHAPAPFSTAMKPPTATGGTREDVEGVARDEWNAEEYQHVMKRLRSLRALK